MRYLCPPLFLCTGEPPLLGEEGLGGALRVYKSGLEHPAEQRSEAPGQQQRHTPPSSAGESTQEGKGEAGMRVDGTPALIKLPGSHLSVSALGPFL